MLAFVKERLLFGASVSTDGCEALATLAAAAAASLSRFTLRRTARLASRYTAFSPASILDATVIGAWSTPPALDGSGGGEESLPPLLLAPAR